MENRSTLFNRELKGHLIVFLTILVWGTTYVSTKVLLLDFTPLEILIIRFTIGFLVLCLIYPKKLKFVSWRQELFFAMAGLTGITLYFLVENIALLYTTASNAGIIITVAPLFTVILNAIFLNGNRPTGHFLLGFLLAMFGIGLITFQQGVALQINPIGDFLALLAAFVWAIYSTLMRKVSEFGHNTLLTTRRGFFYGLLFMLPLTFITDFHLELSTLLKPYNLLNLIFLGCFASAIGFVSWNYAVKILGTVKTSLYIYLSPVVTVLTAMLWLNEKLTVNSVLGIILVLTGLFISEKRRIK